MRERLVCLRHLVNFVTLADGVALALEGFHDFRGERGLHRLAFFRVREIHDPAERERILPFDGDFQRHLIGRTAHAAGLRLDARLGVVHRALQNFDGVARRIFFRDGVERAIDDALRRALLAGKHHGVDEAGDQRVLVFAVLGHWPFVC